MFKIHLLSCLLMLLYFGALGQNKAQSVRWSGTVRDSTSGETLEGVTVELMGASHQSSSCITNAYGFFSLSIPLGASTLHFSHIGYVDRIFPLSGVSGKLLQVALERHQLSADALQNETVQVYAHRKSSTEVTQMGVHHIDMAQVAEIPVIFGEQDVLKTLSLLPGVKQANDGSAGFYVRGSNAGQNLILLDEAPVYNASHLFGFFSTFNSDAIKEVSLIKGNGGAQYGGRLASVLNVRMNEGNNQHYQVAGGIGLISSRLSVEGPIQKNKSSFLITGRRTYADVFLHLSHNDELKDNQLYFYDLNAKANIELNPKNHLYLSGYSGADKLGVKDQFNIDWGNKTATLRWNSILGGGLFSNTSFIYSDYRFNILLKSGNNKFHINSVIRDYHFKQDFDWSRPKGTWRFGLNSIYHEFNPTHFSGGNDSADYSQSKSLRYGWENAAYIDYAKPLGRMLDLDGGLRLSTYSLLGPASYYLYQPQQTDPVDSVLVGKGQFGKTYINYEPRLSLRLRLNEASSLKAAYSRNSQHLHLLSNSVSTNPTDQWMGDSYNMKPETADQYSLGYYRSLNHAYSLEVELYYKWMAGQIDYKNGADLTTSSDVESQLLYGVGRAYGAEFYLKKTKGRWTGWMSYTLSKTEKKIDGINGNRWYNAKQDRTHDFSMVAIYPLSRRWSMSGDFMFSTGNAVTFPEAKYLLTSQTVYYYTKRNGYRMPNYHRMDLNFILKCNPHKHYQASWSFGLYNVYGRENAYVIRFKDDPAEPGKTIAQQTSLFKWVPSVTYNFKF